METEYDFTQVVNTMQLMDEVSTASLPSPDYILTSGVAVQIFYTFSLTDSQAATLSTVVASHIANPAYITLAIQAQVLALVTYLNNPATVNITRAVILANLASNLPLATLTKINAQIAAATGGGG